jgi:hypothetical protein
MSSLYFLENIMNAIEKLMVQLTKVLTMLLGITGSIALVNYCIHNVKSIIDNNPSTIASASVVMYFLFGISMFISFMVMTTMSIEGELEKGKKITGYILLANLGLNFLVPSFFPQNYFSELINYLPFLLANVGILFSLFTVFLSIKSFVKFDAWYSQVKKNMSLYFKNRKLVQEKRKLELQKQKLQEEQKKEQMKPLNNTPSNQINLTVFDTIMAIVPKEKNEEFNEKLNSLKKTMLEILEKPQDIEVYNEVKLLVEQNLPKMTQLYLQSQNEEDKKNALEVLEKMDSYFKFAFNQLVNKQNFKSHLNKESELKYFSEKYSVGG